MVSTLNGHPERWDEQMRDMLGPDADDMIAAFQTIIDEHETFDGDEPVAEISIAVSADDVHRWLPLVADAANESSGPMEELLNTLGTEMCRIYMLTEAIPYDEPCSDTIGFFMSGFMDDEDDDD